MSCGRCRTHPHTSTMNIQARASTLAPNSVTSSRADGSLRKKSGNLERRMLSSCCCTPRTAAAIRSPNPTIAGAPRARPESGKL